MQYILNNPITGDGRKKDSTRGKRTFTAHDNISNSCLIKNTPINKTPNRHKIPDHTDEHFYPQDRNYNNHNLRKSLGTFQPKYNVKDPLSRKLSEMYGQDINVSKSPIKKYSPSPAVSPQKRRILDNLTSHGLNKSQEKTLPSAINKSQEKTLPSDVDWFYVDTIKHRYDFKIDQTQLRSSYKDQRSVMDATVQQNNYYQKPSEKLSKKQEVAQKYTYLRSVKKSDLLMQREEILKKK